MIHPFESALPYRAARSEAPRSKSASAAGMTFYEAVNNCLQNRAYPLYKIQEQFSTNVNTIVSVFNSLANTAAISGECARCFGSSERIIFMGKTAKYISIIVLAILIVITILTSHSNKDNYFIKYKDGAVYIWKGRFSPLGKELFITMPGAQPPNLIQKIYSREEVFPFIAKYYIDMADAILDVPGLPDFEGMRTYLNKSLSYSITSDQQEAAHARLNKIDRMVLLYKADIAVSKDTIPELKTALEYLNRANTLGPDELESGHLKQKIDSIRARMTILETEQLAAAQSQNQQDVNPPAKPVK